MKEAAATELSKKIGDDGIVKIILCKLSCGEKVFLTVTGNSMLPFLADGRDRVVLQRIEKRPKKATLSFTDVKTALMCSTALSGGKVKAFSFPATHKPMLKVRLKEGSFLPAALLPRGTES